MESERFPSGRSFQTSPYLLHPWSRRIWHFILMATHPDLFRGSLSSSVEKIDNEKYRLQLNQWTENRYRVSRGGAPNYNHPETTNIYLCELIENFSSESMLLWLACTKRVMDIVFEIGNQPR